MAQTEARTTFDSFYCSSSPDIHRIGEESSGWVINTRHPTTVAYCAGVGQGISFELELAKITPQPVLVFDPSPTGIATIAKSDTHNMNFFQSGSPPRPLLLNSQFP